MTNCIHRRSWLPTLAAMTLVACAVTSAATTVCGQVSDEVEKFDRELVAPPIPAPLFPETKVECPVPELIRDVTFGGGGRYIIVRVVAAHVVRVFDVSRAEFVREIEVAPDALVAAGLDVLFIAAPYEHRWERWSLSRLRREQVGEFAFPGFVQKLALGHASQGPLLIGWREGAWDSARSRVTLVDPLNLKPIGPLSHPSAAINPNAAKAKATKTPAISVGTIPLGHMPWLDFLDDEMQCLASGNGNLFLLRRGNSQIGCLQWHDGKLSRRQAQVTNKELVPAADGSFVCAKNLLLSSDLFEKGRPLLSGFRLPAAHSEYCLRMSAPSAGQFGLTEIGEIVDRADTRVLMLPRLDEFKPQARPPQQAVFMREDRPLPLPDWKRYWLVPQAEALVTIPPQNDRLVWRRVTISDVPSSPGSPAKEELSPPAEAAVKPALQRRLEDLPTASLRNWSGEEIKTPLVAGAKREIELPGKADLLVVGGGGRYFCVKVGAEVSIVDLAACQIAKRVPVASGAMLAAGQSVLVVVDPQAESAQVLSLPAGDKLRETQQKELADALDLALGHSSDGPLLVVGNKQRPVGTFFELPSLLPRPLKAVDFDDTYRRTRHNLAGFSFPFQDPATGKVPGLNASAAGVGDVFLIGVRGITPSGLRLVSLPTADTVRIDSRHESGGSLSADGRVVFGYGMRTGDLARGMNRGPTIPSYHPRYAVRLADGNQASLQQVATSGDVLDVVDGKTVAALPFLEEYHRAQPQSDPNTFGSIHLIPQARALVTLARSRTRLVLRHFDLQCNTEAVEPSSRE